MFRKEELEEMFKHEIPFDVESWYPKLKEFTFETTFFPLKIVEAVAILQRYRKVSLKRSDLCILNEKEEEEALGNIDNQLKPIIEQMKNVFVRLSTRSPKDVVMDLEENQEFLRDQICEYLKTLPNIQQRLKQIPPISKTQQGEYNTQDLLAALTNEDFNYIVKIVFNSTKLFLKVTNSQDAMKLLWSSERVFTDLKRLLTVQGVEPFNLEYKLEDNLKQKELCKVSCRKWMDGFGDEHEFRCFFYNKKITAISQYNYYFLDKSLLNPSTQQLIQAEILSKFESIKSSLELSSGVIDLAVFYDKSPISSVLIELNPFNDYKGAGTGGSLFCWHKDIEVLKGNLPLEIRVVKDFRDNILENFIPNFSGDLPLIISKAIIDTMGKPEKKCNIW